MKKLSTALLMLVLVLTNLSTTAFAPVTASSSCTKSFPCFITGKELIMKDPGGTGYAVSLKAELQYYRDILGIEHVAAVAVVWFYPQSVKVRAQYWASMYGSASANSPVATCNAMMATSCMVISPYQTGHLAKTDYYHVNASAYITWPSGTITQGSAGVDASNF